jgi:hypothetical protein
MKRLNLKTWLLAASAAVAFTGCDLMKEDLEDCPTGLYVNFVYDYNIQRSDMFKDHVGAVMLYVYDDQNRMVAKKTVGDGFFKTYGRYVHFTEDELQPGTYSLLAVAMQKNFSDALAAPGAKYRVAGDAVGDQRSQLSITLDHSPAPAPVPSVVASPQPTNGTRATTLVPTVAPLDTLWHTLSTIVTPASQHPLQLTPAMLTPAATEYTWQRDGSIKSNGVSTVTVVKGEPTYATMSLIRDTKHLNISLRELDTPENVFDTDYDVFIIDDNSYLDCDNNLVQRGDSVIYRPYAQWTTIFDGKGLVANEHSAHYDLMFNRMMYNATNADDNAILCIRKKSTGQEVAVINLPYILSQGRTAYEINAYQPQEYLDREYDYRLEFFIKNGRWLFIDIHIDILSWAKRIQYVDL